MKALIFVFDKVLFLYTMVNMVFVFVVVCGNGYVAEAQQPLCWASGDGIVSVYSQTYIIFETSLSAHHLVPESWRIYPLPDVQKAFEILSFEHAFPRTSFWERLADIFYPPCIQQLFADFFSCAVIVGFMHIGAAALTYHFLFNYGFWPRGDYGFYRNLIQGPRDTSPLQSIERYKPYSNPKCVPDWSWWTKQDYAYRKWLNPLYEVEHSLADLDKVEILDDDEYYFSLDLDPFLHEDMVYIDPTLAKMLGYSVGSVESICVSLAVGMAFFSWLVSRHVNLVFRCDVGLWAVRPFVSTSGKYSWCSKENALANNEHDFRMNEQRISPKQTLPSLSTLCGCIIVSTSDDYSWCSKENASASSSSRNR